MISLNINQKAGIVQTVASGSTNRTDLETYLLELASTIETVRRKWGRCLHLVDACRLSVRTDRELCCLAGSGIEFQDCEDRVAVVMRSPSAIEHFDHMPSQFRTMVFPSRKAALDWLQATNSGELELL